MNVVQILEYNPNSKYENFNNVLLETYSELDEYNYLRRQWNRCDINDVLYMESDNEKKEGIISKTIELIKNIIDKVKQLVSKTVDSLTNKLRYGSLSDEQKKAYDEFQEELEQHPELKNKKYTVKDWGKIKKEYDKVLDNIDEMMDDDKVDANGLTYKYHSMTDNLNSTIKTLSAPLSIDLILKLARTSPENARTMQDILNKSSSITKNIEEELGNKEVVKLQKNVDKLAKRATGAKLKASLMRHQEQTMNECLKEYMQDIVDLADGNKNMFKKFLVSIKHTDFIKAAGKGVVKSKDVRRSLKGVGKVVEEINKATGEDTAIGQAIRIGKDFVNPHRETYSEQKDRQKKEEKKYKKQVKEAKKEAKRKEKENHK